MTNKPTVEEMRAIFEEMREVAAEFGGELTTERRESEAVTCYVLWRLRRLEERVAMMTDDGR